MLRLNSFVQLESAPGSWNRFCDHTTPLRPERDVKARRQVSNSNVTKRVSLALAGARAALYRCSYMHPDTAVKALFIVSIVGAVALLAYFRVPLGGCGASSALDDFAPPKRKKRVKHADD